MDEAVLVHRESIATKQMRKDRLAYRVNLADIFLLLIVENVSLSILPNNTIK
ncbi:MAG: hypothetical protein JXB26_10225 [Candidatus Aminicenantes bacterium]|nr:hypothetical protein [Candidatus Aminicenantes bacterium]